MFHNDVQVDAKRHGEAMSRYLFTEMVSKIVIGEANTAN